MSAAPALTRALAFFAPCGQEQDMNGHAISLAGQRLVALASGALFWPSEGCLIVSDLHLGRSERYARRGGALLPPYEVDETLARLDADVSALAVRMVICLGDTFDDLQAAELAPDHALWLARLMAGRRWVWIAGNHDPAPLTLAGEHLAVLRMGALTFRHIPENPASGEVSGHYHPKLRLAGQSRRCFLADGARVILPAYGTYTGGLSADDPALVGLMAPGAIAILTGPTARPVPLPAKGAGR